MKKSQNNYLLKKRLEVLKFAKIFVSEKGLTKNSLENISKRYGIDINETELLFPEGNIDLIQFTLEQLNKELEEYCRKIDLIRLPVHKRIKKSIAFKNFFNE
jgi:ubiquinone biosynthesis protein COQ9